jgi:hypothetical protein
VLNARANDIGPILPKYIVNIIVSLPKRSSFGVSARERPTVAVALTVSNIRSIKGASVVADKRSVDTSNTKDDIRNTPRVLRRITRWPTLQVTLFRSTR